MFMTPSLATFVMSPHPSLLLSVCGNYAAIHTNRADSNTLMLFEHRFSCGLSIDSPKGFQLQQLTWERTTNCRYPSGPFSFIKS